ncbi:hypothetical protein NGF19_02185 [Streptomyces sp. RY43-2]|uniref:Lipoprotein n=1 Tax=Streptomyces macrolidinus TaxID=2952607 RepID=A0ABT0Z755_9ACTN|nr:hypothetical protein [Streptomyces macrolidinus]MCN9239599.1 hypothetical protein [Streptomyces macrolidinus]
MFTLASCTSSGNDNHASASSPPTPSSSPTATGLSEQQLTKQAQDALAAVHTGHLVEGGTERVTDGIHTEPMLDAGKAYRLTLVCVGSGSAHVTFTPASAGKQSTLPCDQSVAQQRITAPRQIRLDVDATKGATGVIAWQIDSI